MAQNLDTVLAHRDVPQGAFLDGVPLFGGARARRLARMRKIRRASAVVLAVLLCAGGAFVTTQRNATSAVSLDEAVERFRTDGAATPSQRTAGGASDSKKVETAPVGTQEKALASLHGVPDATTDVARPHPAEELVAGVLPTEGVYAYRTKGGENISIFGASHTYPEQTFAIVRHLGGCRWENRNQVIEEHTDIRTLCNEPHNEKATFMQLVQERQVEFFGKRDGARLICKPSLVLHGHGAGTATSCNDGEGTNARLDSSFLGIKRMIVGGVPVRAVRIHIAGRITGRVQGTSTDDLWLAPDTGMTLRWDRTVDTLADAFGGAKVRYTEDASFVLESLDPRK